jgi:transcriptional regulator with XRE-family HTH domain
MIKSKLSTSRHRRFNWRAYGRRLRLARLTLGISEAAAAEAHGVTLTTYRRWEAGARQSNRPEPMLRFAERYGVSIDWHWAIRAALQINSPSILAGRLRSCD